MSNDLLFKNLTNTAVVAASKSKDNYVHLCSQLILLLLSVSVNISLFEIADDETFMNMIIGQI